MAAKNGRYSLVINDKTCISVPWNFSAQHIKSKDFDETTERFKNKTKVPLSVIDAFTTQFYDEQSLCIYLSKVYETEVKKVDVTYKEKGKTRKVPVVYGLQNTMCNIACNNFGEYTISEDEQDYMIDIIERINRKMSGLYTFLTEEKYITDKLAEYFENYIDCPYSEIQFAKRKIKSRLNYRSYRDICEGMQDYHDLLTELFPPVENSYTLDPEEEMERLNYPVYDETELEEAFANNEEDDIYNNVVIDEHGQSVIPLQKTLRKNN